MDKFLSIFDNRSQEVFLYTFALIIFGSIFYGIRYQQQFAMLVPFGVLLVYVSIVDFSKIYFLLMAMLPFSMETYLPGGLATDLPSEPLMLLLTGIYLLYFVQNLTQLRAGFFLHPVTVFLVLHFLWIAVSAIPSENPLVSVKYSLAKFWYIVAFYFMSGLMLTAGKAIRVMIWCVSIAMAITIIFVMVQHSVTGFAFDTINRAVRPFYRNHVNYAAMLTLFLPFIWYLKADYPRFSFKWSVLWSIILIVLLGITLAYTRAAYIALLAAIGVYGVVKFRLMKLVLTVAVVGSIAITSYFLTDNTYMDYAPEFEKTIAHKQFNSLVEATTKGEDISVMERFYRWLAGVYMVQEKPCFGFGPGNFHEFYKGYTVSRFTTYVSDNPEKSGIHNYYLMLGVEQGIPGIFFFVMLLFYFFYKSEIVWHQTKAPLLANALMAAIMCVAVIAVLLIINDLIETDKVGSFFFISLAILVNVDLHNRAGVGKELVA